MALANILESRNIGVMGEEREKINKNQALLL